MNITGTNWAEILALLSAHEEFLCELPPYSPTPETLVCRDSWHRTLGHLSACQTTWLQLMQFLLNGTEKGDPECHPWQLYQRNQYAQQPWSELLAEFQMGRASWRLALDTVKPSATVQTKTKRYDARELTRRLVLHEEHHLAEHGITR